VRLQFDRFRGFVEEYSANLSLGGMFIRTDQPAAVGTEMPIEFRLGADYELIKGRGRVVWAREDAVDDEHPAGMGIRFLELTPGSRELIFKLVERRVREGGDPFDLEHEADLLPDRPPEPGPAPEHAVTVPAEAEDEPLPAPPLDSVLEGGAGRATAAGLAAGAVAGAGHRDEPELAPLELSAPRPDGGWSGDMAESDPLPRLEDWDGAPVAWTEGAGAETEAGDERAGAEAAAAFAAGSAAGRDLATGPADETAGATAFDGAAAQLAGNDDAPPAADDERWVTPFGGQGATSGDASGDAQAPRWQDPPEEEAGWSGGSWTGETAAAATETPGREWSSAETAAPAAGPGPGTGYAAEAPPSRLRRVLVWLLPLTAIVVLAAGWWLLGSPLPGGDGQAAPAAGEAPAGTAGAGAAPAGDAAGDAGTSRVDRADIEGLDADGVLRTPPDPATTADAAGPPDAATAADGVAGAGEPGDDGRSPAEPAGAGRSAEPPAAGPLTTVREVTWSTGAGRTVLTVRGDGAIAAAAVSDFRIEGDEPRHVVRLRGVTRPLSPASLEVGSPQVRRVRAGLHAERSPSELHLVLDLGGPAVRVTGVEPAGGGLRIVVEGTP
jgi:type IV pilus assembly protein PilZ